VKYHKPGTEREVLHDLILLWNPKPNDLMKVEIRIKASRRWKELEGVRHGEMLISRT
jgi:hypothetical protein